MVKNFIFVWIFYWFLVLLVPIESIYNPVIQAFLLQLFFVFTVLLGYVCFGLYRPYAIMSLADWNDDKLLKYFCNVICISLIMSLVGTLFLVFDKVVVQGIDYSKGIAFAREAWRKAGEERDGQVSSIFSVLGYLLSSSYFVAATSLMIIGKFVSRFNFLKFSVCVFILLMVNCLLTGGRSSILLIVVFLFAAKSLIRDWSLKKITQNNILYMTILLLTLTCVLYILYVFDQRASASGVSVSVYLDNFLPWLGLRLSFSGLENSDDFFSNMFALLILAISYITHSFSSTAAIIAHGEGNAVIAFVYPMKLLHKLHLIPPQNVEWFLAGKFPSLPGALFYQFGLLGFIIMSFIIGFFSGLAKQLVFSRPYNLIFLCFYFSMYSILILSPLLLAVDFLSFPFVVISFIGVNLIAIIATKVKFRK